MRRPPLLLALLSLVGLMGGGCVKPDDRVDLLAARIVAQLKADPLVTDAQYRYTAPQGIDDADPHLTFSIEVLPGHAGADEWKPQTRRVVEEVWKTPARLNQVKVVFNTRSAVGASPEQSDGAGTMQQPLFQVQVNLLFNPANTVQPSAEPTFSVEPRIAERHLDEWRFAQELQRDLYATYGPHKTS
ncbi:hypothetical protein Srot_1718 [Segniliparus rotundus DSM 44985]|uniref:Lipoprotein n=1 Tax=Segniliparus rotundus (strain ATCC BAA-972 / CDC 1076 / CIP 108378 / DSM 44985 / JCM 13578) TaxID=640132 RepID=D6Z898_SEGRD|nr:hypothetical protein [Segniliparus rotundus]ADG98178.1 hypothetical protein Srot_1718 [Segniliparus rotundus DSM 44985]